MWLTFPCKVKVAIDDTLVQQATPIIVKKLVYFRLWQFKQPFKFLFSSIIVDID